MECAMLFVKVKTSRQPCFQFPNCVMYTQLAWYIPLIHWLPTTGYRKTGKQTAQWSVRIWNTSAALQWMEWWVHSWCELANLFHRSNYRSPGHSEQQFLLWCVSTVNSRQQHKCTYHLQCCHCSPEGGGCMALQMSIIFTTLPLSEACAVKT